MKNSPLYRRLLSIALAFAMIFATLTPTSLVAKAAGEKAETKKELELTPIDPSTLESRQPAKAHEKTDKELYSATDVVRVSIELEKASTLEAGYSMKGIAQNTAAKSYRAQLRADQDAMTAKIEKAIGSKLDVKWNLTLAANIISANVLYGKIDAIKSIKGVKDVFVENRYEPQVDLKLSENYKSDKLNQSQDSAPADEPNNGAASYMIGSNLAWAAGYTGAGSKVAVIDTGIDDQHQSFAAEAFEYALQQNAEALGVSYEEYIASLDLLTAEKIEAVKDQLNANIGSGATAYRSTKIGYGYNYIDKNSNINHMGDSAGTHGSHVEGIAAGNRFIKVDGEFKDALLTVGTQGVAPDAQIVTMKVFGAAGGAYDSDYMVAIEDAIILGCDSANLSLGSGSPGFGFSGEYERVMNKIVENGMVVAMSAGNSGMWYDSPKNPAMAYPYIYLDDSNFATGGSPGSFTNTLATASVDNNGQIGMPLYFGDLHVFYSETDGYSNQPIATLAGQPYEYVLLPGVGVTPLTDADDDNGSTAIGTENDEFAALGSEVLAGKIAMCFRGSSSFFVKANAAMKQGAAGIIIINNQPGVINMNLTGYSYTAPAVSITNADGLAIIDQSEAVTDEEDHVLYYTGSMTVGSEIEIQVPEITDSVTVSSFSSFGVPGTLVLKPEILAPGGNIYSVWGANNSSQEGEATSAHDQYISFSGTSMASPQIAGMAAVLGQYIRENDLCEKTGLSQRQLINSLLMSTAHPVFDEYDEYHPVIRVGSGLANLADAIAAQSYILMDEDATMFPDSAKDGKVKAELGDDPERTGEYSFSFTVNPLTDKKEFTLRTELFTQDIAGNAGYGMLAWNGSVRLESLLEQGFGQPLPAYDVLYLVNGEVHENTYLLDADVNGDGVTNKADAQAILDFVASKEIEIDEDAADIDGDGAITSYDAQLLLEGAVAPILSITEPTEVTVYIQLSPYAQMLLDYYYTGGAYIQGYTFIDPVADEEGAMDVTHSIPILAYYGSWTDSAMLDRTSVIDEAYGTGKLPYINVANTNYMLIQDAEGLSTIYMGNPYAVEDKFPVERLALNSETMIQQFNYLNIRGAATLGFAVQAEDGKVLFAQATPAQKYGAYFHVNQGTWQNTNPSNYKINKKLSAAGVQEGDKVTVGFYALPEYYAILAAKMKGEVATSGNLDNDGFKAVLESGAVGIGAGISYDVVIDNTAPVVEGALLDLITGDIFVRASDNNYIAYVAILNKSGSKEFFGTVPEQTEAGQKIEVPLELEGQSLPSEVVLLVADYAGNEATFAVNLGGEAPDYGGTMIGFVPETTTAAPGSGNRICPTGFLCRIIRLSRL